MEEISKEYFLNRHHVLDVLSYFLKRQKERKSASLVRLGDGEGRLLGFPEFVDKTSEGNTCLDHSLKIWFGRSDFLEEELIDLSLQLRGAVKNADVVGLPRLKQHNAHRVYRYVEEATSRFQLLDRKRQLKTDAAIHRYLQFGLFYQRLLNNLDFVGLITGRSQLAGIVKNAFSIKEVKQYLIPAEAIHPGGLEGDHYPDRFHALKSELLVPYPGAVFLVGAGVLGKLYCDWIKSAGGIAIDIGSICDAWANEGRLQHDYHLIKHYADLSPFSLNDGVNRFNQACDHFDMDTTRLTSDHLDAFIAEYGK